LENKVLPTQTLPLPGNGPGKRPCIYPFLSQFVSRPKKGTWVCPSNIFDKFAPVVLRAIKKHAELEGIYELGLCIQYMELCVPMHTKKP